MKNIKAIIFDVDGVLIDSFQSNLKFFQDVLKEAGYKKPTEKQYRKGFHLTLEDAIKFLAGIKNDKEFKRVLRIAKKAYSEPEELILPERSVETIKELSKKYKLGLATGRIKLGVDEYFNFAKNRKCFKAVVHFSHYTNPKPHPEPLLIALKKLGAKPDEAIYIGDSQTDIQAARAAGMKIILFSKRKLAGADYRTFSFGSLPDLIEKIKIEK